MTRGSRRVTTLAYGDGQRLAYTDAGDPGGYPVLVQHGMIASIRDIHLFGRAIAAGGRVISIARPGYGESSPYAMHSIAEWGDVVATLVDALELAQFDVLGISSGAPYSYAIGARLPYRVRTIYILSGTPALSDAAIQALWPYPLTTGAAIPELQAVARAVFFPNPTEDDLARDDVRDSMSHDCFGIALDLRLRCRDWGFRLSDVATPVVMQHSRTDTQVPFVTAEMTARLLPNCRLVVREAGEHFSPALLSAFIDDEGIGRAP
jgi:pimeloyl-ACP methyl ester carboxylesterase